MNMTAGDFIGKYATWFDACLFKSLDLNIKGLLARGYTGITEESHRQNCLLNRLID